MSVHLKNLRSKAITLMYQTNKVSYDTLSSLPLPKHFLPPSLEDVIPPNKLQSLERVRELNGIPYPRSWQSLVNFLVNDIKESGLQYKDYSKFKLPNFGDVKERSTEAYLREFIEKLNNENENSKLVHFSFNVFHIKPRRLYKQMDDIKGLSLRDAFLQIAWNKGEVSELIRKNLVNALIKAKLSGMDLNKTYVAYMRPHGPAVLQSEISVNHLKGRGRYGATEQPHSAVVRVILQERETPFEIILKDPLYEIKQNLREKRAGNTICDPNIIYEKHADVAPVKAIYA